MFLKIDRIMSQICQAHVNTENAYACSTIHGFIFNACTCVFFSHSEVFAEALCSGDYSQCLAELEVVPVSSLWPKNSTLRALASLLTADDPQVNKAAADYLSSGASRGHFRTRVSSAKERGHN